MFVLNDNFKICQYSDDIVILDITNDSYSILENVNSKLICDIDISIRENFHQLIEEGVLINSAIQKAETMRRDYLEERWIKPAIKNAKTNISQLVKTYVKIKTCEYTLSKKGFSGVLHSLQRARHNIKYKPNDEFINEHVMHHLNEAYPYSNNNSNCLTYSFCLASILTTRNINAKLIVGVRTRPFYSHAWVEVDGNVINDDAELRNKLSVIWEI